MRKFIVFVFVCLSCSTLIVQFTEYFETTVALAGWATFIGSYGFGTVQDWQVSNISNIGSQAAYGAAGYVLRTRTIQAYLFSL